jgi:glycerol-3-phosphate acyltransferase PlsX
LGGAPLLGVNGVVIIAHGRSNATAIANAIRAAADTARLGVQQALTEAVSETGNAPVARRRTRVGGRP